MMQFYADFFNDTMGRLSAFEVRAVDEDRNTPAKPEFTAQLYASLGVLRGHAILYGFTSTAQQCGRMMDLFDHRQMEVTCGESRDELKDLRRRFQDDLASHYFIHLTMQEAKNYEKPLDGWGDITASFPEAIRDIEEMNKCLALNRYPACVFHSMQVIEHGLIHLGKWLGVKDHKPGWNATTRELTRICRLDAKDRDSWETKHHGFISQMDAVAYSLMTAWRHKIDHAAGRLSLLPGDFAPEIAEEIVSASRGFMRRLATELPTDHPRP